MCLRTHSSAGPLASEWRESLGQGCPPPDTRKATVCRDQVGGREVVGRSISKQHLHLFSAAIWCCTKYTGQFQFPHWVYNSFGTRLRQLWHLCRCLTPLSLTRVPTYTYWLREKWAESIRNRLLPSRPWGWPSPQWVDTQYAIVILPQPHETIRNED